MSKPIPAINRYKADLREFSFLLFEQFRIDKLLGKAPVRGLGRRRVQGVADECYRWVREVTGPLNAIGDHEGCKLVDGQGHDARGLQGGVEEPLRGGLEAARGRPRVRRRRRAARAAGPRRGDDQRRQHGVRHVLGPRLRRGRGHRVVRHARSRRSSTARACSTASGAARCASPSRRPAATSGSAKTTASRNADGSYTIRGTKIFISGGDHDLAENIVHLVLARVDGAPAGHQGAHALHRSRRSAPTTTACSARPTTSTWPTSSTRWASTARRRACSTSATQGKCIGWPVGGDAKLNQGMPQMFKLMNSARIARRHPGPRASPRARS